MTTESSMASRELAARIAVEVFGMWQEPWEDEHDHWWQKHSSDPDAKMHASIGFPPHTCGWNSLPRFSTDIGAAWQVVEKVQADNPGWRFSLLGGDEGWWNAEFFGHIDPTKNYGQRHSSEYAPTAPLAICLAALRALENKEPK